MQKPTKRWVSLSFKEVRFVDIAMVGVMQKSITENPPSKTTNQILIYNSNYVPWSNIEDPYPIKRCTIRVQIPSRTLSARHTDAFELQTTP